MDRKIDHAMDYSKAEERVLRALTVQHGVVPKLSVDIHIMSAARIFGVPYSSVTTSQRQEAKRRTYALSYATDHDQRDLLLPSADDLTRMFTPDELAEHCEAAGVEGAQALNKLIRAVYLL